MPQLPLHDGGFPTRSRSKAPLLLLLAVPALLLLHSPLTSTARPPIHDLAHHHPASEALPTYKAPQCPKQVKAIKPAKVLSFDKDYRDAAAQRLSEAVQIATISYDDNDEPLKDPRWAPFFVFDAWLQRSFPTVFQHPRTTVEHINTLGLLVTIEGSDPTLKPLMLMSHTDVTPAPLETYDRWTHPPFSGFVDDHYVWGRGASDDKTLLVGQYAALSLLLEDPTWTPRRTIILSHGFAEEEVHSQQGAVQIGKFLEKRYGHNSMLLVIDEGTTFAKGFGVEMAAPSSSEKGYFDVRVRVATEGGHSSVPFLHSKHGISAIGIMSELVVALHNNPYPSNFEADDPLIAYLACAAEHAPNFPKKWSKLLEKGSKGWLELADGFAALGPMEHSLVTTTQAIDVIKGGGKVNSLPESVEMLMNHRIQFSSSINQTKAHIVETLKPIAKKFKLDLHAFDGAEADLGNAYILLETLGTPLEPAPRSRTSGAVWDLFSGSIKAAFPTKDGAERIVTPYASTGNTDTKAMHALSRSIFRFKGEPGHGGGNAHTVDERASIDGHLGIISWIATIVQNADAFTGEE